MGRFSPTILTVFYLGVFLLRIVRGQPPQHVASAASADDDESFLRSESPGVAFSLRPDYGTVAVKLRGQAPVAVARVEGTEAYKRLMWRPSAPASAKVSDHSTWCALYKSAAPLSVQDYLSYCPEDPDVEAVQELLYALKRAAEAHLGHIICLVNISLLDRRVVEGHLEQIIHAALANLGLTQALTITPDAYALALWNEGLYEVYAKPEQDLSFLVLTIESSSSGVINLDLPLLDDSGSMIIRRDHNVTGTAIPPQCLNRNGPVSCTSLLSQRRRAIREALTSLKTPPFGELPWAGEMPTNISRLLVYGDAANDAILQEELLTLFGPDLSMHAVAQHPVYAAALGGARQAFVVINDVTYDGRPSTWCCLRSWGKACPNNPQRIDI